MRFVSSFSRLFLLAPHISQYSLSTGLWNVHCAHAHTPDTTIVLSSWFRFATFAVLVAPFWKKL